MISEQISNNIFYGLRFRSTSYKCFLLSFLFRNVNYNKISFSFDELSKGMVLEAWNYLPHVSESFGKNDEIYDLCVDIIVESHNEINAYSSTKDVDRYISSQNSAELKKRMNRLCLYAPYRLDVNAMIEEQLHGVADRKKNGIIEELSHKYDLFYSISGKQIVINMQYVEFIINNRITLLRTLDDFIKERYIIK